MDISLNWRPQDSHYSYSAERLRPIDVRIFTIPGQHGEKMVLSLVDQTPVIHNLEALGFLDQNLNVLRQACRDASGLIVIVGPTGSCKTTTLYAMLNVISTPGKNIPMIENPVEYELRGIN